MKESNQYIERYQNQLPRLKAKIAAVAMLLVLAFLMAGAASFAWLVISRSPEVSGVSTTIAANGNLEIALAGLGGHDPEPSAVGDSVKDMLERNITWGNLVNLSDSRYGLNNMILRPATLNGNTGLLTSPLYGAKYSADGRFEMPTTADDFSYVYYTWDEDAKDYVFKVDSDLNHYGVRAISTVQWVNLGGDEILKEMSQKANESLNNAKSNYASITSNQTYINSLQGLIEIYAQSTIDGNLNDMVVDKEYVVALYQMLDDIKRNVMDSCADSYLAMANMCAFKETGKQTEYTRDTLCASVNKLPAYIKGNLNSLTQFVNDRNQMINNLDPTKTNSLAYWAQQAEDGKTVYWKNIAAIINWFCSPDSCTVDGYNMSTLRSNAPKIINNRSHSAVITTGALQRIEQRIGERMSPKIKITIDASKLSTMLGVQTLDNITITTKVDEKAFQMPKELETVKKSSGWVKGTDGIAQDTYAYAIDFWVRTNADASYLTLEGNVLTKTEEVDETDALGRKLYTAKYEYEGESKEEKVYEENGKYYLLDGTPVDSLPIPEEIEVQYIPLKKTVTTVIGYEGEDRVWEDSQLAGAIVAGKGATQGSGSCYVFYANNSADQERFLKLLANVKVVFIDDQGTKMATAFLDVEHCYADYGKVTVPLVLDENDSVVINDKRYITALTKNEATRITALVYLDGASIENSMVLSSSEVEGTLNIQFGSSRSPLYALENEELMKKKLSISASVSHTEFVYDKNQPASTDLTILVDGTVPKTVTAKFVRKISNTNSSYGSWPLDPIELTKNNGDGTTWTGTGVFLYPGEYILKSVFVDNMEYPLDQEITVKVDGTIMAGLSFANTDQRLLTVMSAERYYSTAIRVTTSSSDDGQVIFVNEQTQDRVTVSLKRKSGTYDGTATFTSSGTYVAKYYSFKSKENPSVREEFEFPPEEQLMVTVSLGLNASVYITCDPDTLAILNMIQNGASPANFVVPDETSLQKESLARTLLEQIEKNQALTTYYSEKKSIVDDLLNAVKGGTTVDHLDSAKLAQLSSLKNEIDQVLNPEETDIQTFSVPAGQQLTDEERIWMYDLSDDLTLLGRLCDSLDTSIEDAINKLKNGTVTLNVSCKVMDNSGEVIKDLSDLKLFYAKSGSNALGLDGDMEWNSDTDSYEGHFLVKQAGVYSFKNVTISINGVDSVVARYTSAPSIRAMPPADTYYVGSSTIEYQYVPNGNAVMSVDLAYSSAARVTATIADKDGNQYTVSDDVTSVEVTKGDVPTNAWRFKIPSIGGTQDGYWTLKDITLYGVYYDGKFYDDVEGSQGVTISLGDEKIETKAVQNVYITISGNNKDFTGYFMDSHTVGDMTVTIADFEGESIRDKIIENLKVQYDLDESKIGIGQNKTTKKDYEYQYTVDGLDAVKVVGTGSLKPGSATEYSVSLNFQYAGPYVFEQISFTVNNETFTTKFVDPDGTNKNRELRYVVDGAKAEKAPEVDVKWIAPTVKITGTNPAPSSSFNLGDPDATAHNYYEDFYANVYGRKSGTLFGRNTYALPKITLNLTNAGTNISSTNKLTFTIPNQNNSSFKNDVVFTANNSSKETEVGATENSGGSRRYCDDVKISTVAITYGGKSFTVKLSNEIHIYEGNNPLGSFAYNVDSEYADMIDVSAEYDKIEAAAKDKGVVVKVSGSGVECYDGRQFSVTLPAVTVTKIVQVPVGDSVITYRYTETTQPIKWTTSESDGCNGNKTVDHTGSKVTTKIETISTGEMATYERTYKIDKWQIETFSVDTGASSGTTQVNPGTVRNIRFTNRQVATPIVSYVDSDQIGDPVSGSSVTATEETVVWKEGNTTISEPSNWSNNGNATVKTWEE